jgi:hypothetical protein
VNRPNGVPDDADLIRFLGLTRTMLIRRAATADACAAFQDATSRSAAVSATMAMLAASCWTLVDRREGLARWQAAYERCRLINHSYSGLLSVCAGVRHEEKNLSGPARTAVAVLSRLLNLAWLAALQPESISQYHDQVQHLGSKVEALGGQFPGQLRLPLRRVYLFSEAVCGSWPDPAAASSARASAEHLLRIAADVVRAAQDDQYHWRRILPGFMPLEPEWLALGRIMYQASDRLGLDFDRRSRSNLDQLERLPIVIAASMPPPASADEYQGYPSPPDGAAGKTQPHRPEGRSGGDDPAAY